MITPKKDTVSPEEIEALAASRFQPATSANNADARAAFASLIGGGGFESLPEGGKEAFRAFAQVDTIAQQPNALTLDPALQPKWRGAMQACLDAVRDARTLGVFDASAASPAAPTAAEKVATSKDPQVKNQMPAGTVGEGTGPMTGTSKT